MTGPFDYNRMPLAPMGCTKVQVHEKTDKQDTWAFHSVDGFGTSPLLQNIIALIIATSRAHIVTG